MQMAHLNNRRTMKSILLFKKRLGLVEMTSGLVSATVSVKIVGTLLCLLVPSMLVYKVW